eukprot:3633204-Pleurochrysis_carterae.AAC.1
MSIHSGDDAAHAHCSAHADGAICASVPVRRCREAGLTSELLAPADPACETAADVTAPVGQAAEEAAMSLPVVPCVCSCALNSS